MRLITILVISLVLLGGLLPVWAYENDGRSRTISGGPHRKINELAIQSYLAGTYDDVSWTPLLARYARDQKTEITGRTVIEPGMEFITEGDRKGTWKWWIIEGGYTADEPELYNSFRHFYDPLQNDGVPYLTDHLKQLDYLYRTLIITTKTGRVVGAVAGTSVNPQVDARSWAISGEKKKGFGPNNYCWNNGVQDMQLAFACTVPAAIPAPGIDTAAGTVDINKQPRIDKERLFASAWRSLGESMHLLADMTSIPHVRNDSHPGRAYGDFVNDKLKMGLREAFFVEINNDPNLGTLHYDPYELLATEKVVTNAAKSSLDPIAQKKIDGTHDPLALFHEVALYTNKNFFSADTISGNYLLLNKEVIHSANGMKDYPSPKLETCNEKPKDHYLWRTINGKDIRVADITWLSDEGWGGTSNPIRIAAPCVVDEASILVPIAVYANAKLLDWFIPRLEVKITNFDRQTHTVTGEVIHYKHGAYDVPMKYNSDDRQIYQLFADGKPCTLDPRYNGLTPEGTVPTLMNIKDGKLTLDVGKLDLSNAKQISLLLDIGGLSIMSNDYTLAPFDTSRYKAVGVDFNGMTSFTDAPDKSVNYGVSIPPVMFRMAYCKQPGVFSWNGLTFHLKFGSDEEKPTNDLGEFTTELLDVTGTLSSDGQRVVEFTAVHRKKSREVTIGKVTIRGKATTTRFTEIIIAGNDLPLYEDPKATMTYGMTFALTGPEVMKHITQVKSTTRTVRVSNIHRKDDPEPPVKEDIYESTSGIIDWTNTKVPPFLAVQILYPPPVSPTGTIDPR